MREVRAAFGRWTVGGACAFALLAGACGTVAAAPSTDSGQQGGSTRTAYTSMVALEKGGGQGQGGQGQGGGDPSSDAGPGGRADGGAAHGGGAVGGASPGAGGGTSPGAGGGAGNGGGSGDATGGSDPRPGHGLCDPVTLTAKPVSPQIIGAIVTLTGAASNCPHASYEFWIKAPGREWSVLHRFGPRASTTWKTGGLAPGAYALDVWAKKTGSSRGDDLHISPLLQYTLVAQPAPPVQTACTSVTWNQPNPAPPQPPGIQVTLSGLASGCASPLYEFWVRPGSSSTWTLLQVWSPNSTATWDTTGLATGPYLFDIWAKHAAAVSTWEAHLASNPTYTLQAGPPCTSVTWNAPRPAEPQTPGTQVTLGGTATGCPNPTYEYWILAPGSTTWNILQAYRGSSTATWNTTALATGTYLFDIWVRELGSSASWEAHISPNPTDTLEMGPACTSSTLAFAPASPSAAGTTITLTSTSTGCPNPVYEFWVLAPGGSWTILQAYSAAATATWSTTGLAAGTYLFDVWVKNAGNSPLWEAHISPNPTYTLN